jgi:fibronectin type 3 domain-containing protein
VVSASQSGYTFTPSTASATVNGAAVSGVNFTGAAIPLPLPHSVMLNWLPSTTPGVTGYNLYRAEVSGGTYVKLNTPPIVGTTFVDSSVASGRMYYYVSTAVDNNSAESTYSNQAIAAVPTP